MDEINQTPQAQQATNPTPVPANNPKSSKLIPIILGVAVVAIVAIGAYILGAKQSQPVVQNSIQTTPSPSKASATEGSPTPDEIANWKTYKNEKYGFEIKYPEGWQVNKHKSSDTYYISNIELDKKYREASNNIATEGTAFNNGVFISIYESEMALESFIESYYNNPDSPHGNTIKSTKNVEFPNGMQAIFVESNTGGYGLDSATLLKYKNYAFRFTKHYGGSFGLPKYSEKQFDQILATFRFTNQITSPQEASSPCPPNIDINIPC